MNKEWIIRHAVGGDLAFIYATWTHSYRYGSLIGKSCRNSIFFDQYHRVIDGLLSEPDISIRLAVKIDQPHVIFSYCISQPEMIHYIYTKESFTNLGLARALFDDAGEIKFYTHKTFDLNPILKKYPNKLVYNPFLLFHKGGSNYHGSRNQDEQQRSKDGHPFINQDPS